MAPRLVEEKVEAVLIFGEANRNYHQAVRIFNERFPDRPISRKYFRELVQKFLETGNVNEKKKTGRPRITEDLELDIIGEIIVNPTSTTAAVSETYGVARSTVQKYLKKNKFHPYKLKHVHELNEDDPDRRVQFCELMTDRLNINEDLVSHICFSDECTFFLNGFVNRQNVRYWSDENPRIVREVHSQYPQKLNVWAGILGNHIVGPIFINGNLNGEEYLNMLRNYIQPRIQEIVEQNPHEFHRVIF